MVPVVAPALLFRVKLGSGLRTFETCNMQTFGGRKTFNFVFVLFFAGEQFPTDLSAGALTVKEATKARLNLVPCGCARTYDSCYLGLG